MEIVTEDPTQQKKPEERPAEKPCPVGYSLIAFGGTDLLSTIIFSIILDRFALDFGSIIVFLLGFSVLKGSRSAIKWSLAIMTLYTLVAFLLDYIMLFGDPYSIDLGGEPITEEGIFWTSIIFPFVVLWALANVVFLYRHLVRNKPVVPEKPVYYWVLIPALIISIPLGLMVGFQQYFKYTIPQYAKVSAIENRYAAQVKRIRDLASDSFKQGSEGTINNPTNVKLFGIPEILEVRVSTYKKHGMFGGRVLTRKPGCSSRSITSIFVSSPKEGEAVVNIRSRTLETGRSLKTADYEGVAKDEEGKRVYYIIIFDLDELERKYKKANPANR